MYQFYKYSVAGVVKIIYESKVYILNLEDKVTHEQVPQAVTPIVKMIVHILREQMRVIEESDDADCKRLRGAE
jgi:hypothetical protein